MADFNTPAGFGFIAGRGRERARQVLEATEAAGYDPETVLTRNGGYLAPQEVVNSIAESDDDDARRAETDINNLEEQQKANTVRSAGSTDGENGSEDETGDPAGQGGDSSAVDTGNGDGGNGDGEKPAETEEEKAAREAAEAKPAGNASTEEWSDWAVKYKGYDAAEKLTRSQLVERYGA